MSSIQRSKSTPHVHITGSGAGLSRSFSHAVLSSRVVAHPRTLPSPTLHTPRKDREDPFSLTGFFPSYPNVEEWSWLRRDEDNHTKAEQSEEEHEEYHNVFGAEAGLGIERRSILVHDAVAEVIKKEDKLGILALDMVFSMQEHDIEPVVADDLLLSPYAEDGAVDEDSLYLALSGLRARAEMGYKIEAVQIGELFFGPDEEEENGRW